MPAEIKETDTMFSHRKKPWHGLGKVVDKAPTSEEAIQLAGLDWEVEKVPVIVDGKTLTDRVGLVRNTDRRLFSIVGPRYRPLQNKDAFSVMDFLLEEGVKYETAGSLFNGKKVFLTCALETDWEVAGDNIKSYLLLSNSHAGNESLTIAITPIRVVCNNTLQIALRSHVSRWSIPHFSSMGEKIVQAQEALKRTNEYMNYFCEYGNRAADKKIGDGTLAVLTEELFPIKQDHTERQLTNRSELLERFEYCLDAPDLKDFRGTAWGILNAVSDYETHSQIRKRERILNSALVGSTPLLRKATEFLRLA